MNSDELLFMEPIFHNKIWGGRRLEYAYGYEIPDGPVGEEP
jgi:mannose-6-phosphate isomerase class I